MTPSRRELVTVFVASLIAPTIARAQDSCAVVRGPASRTISARVRLPGGAWKRFSCSVPPGIELGHDAALAWVRERNGVDASAVADLVIV